MNRGKSFSRRMRKLAVFFLFGLASSLTGCFESEQDFSINPDGSGKMLLVAVFDPSILTLGQGKDSTREMQDAAKKILEKSEGIEVWKDVTFSRTPDGRVSFKGTGYFKDLSKVKIANFGTEFSLTKEGNILTLQMKEEEEKKPAPKAAPRQLSEAEVAQKIQEAKGEWERSKPMMAAMLSGLKKGATLRFRGNLVELNNFEKVSESAIRISIEGTKMIDSLDQMMADDAWMREQALAGGLEKAGGPPAMDESFNERFFGQKGPVRAKIEVSSKPMFDYKKEVAVAMKAYPKLQESLGIVSKLPAGSTLKEGLTFSVGEVRDTRTTGEFFGGLDVELVMSGDILSKTRGIRKLDLQKAEDDTGQNLLKEASEQSSSGFQQQSGSDNEGQLKEKLQLKNPVRAATAIRELSGTVLFYMPDKDPKAAKAVVKGFMKQTGKPITQDLLLKKAKVELAVLTKAQYDATKAAREETEGGSPPPKDIAGALLSAFSDMFSGFAGVDENDLVFLIKDPGGRLVDVEIQDATGKPLPTQSSSSYGDMRVFSFEQLPGADAQLAVYLETSASLVQAPFNLANVVLP